MKFLRLQHGLRRRLADWLRPGDPSRDRALSAYYAQQGSCQIPEMWFLLEKYLGRTSTGTFVEVGAFDGVTFSNTHGLVLRGWTGLMIEPEPDAASACRANHEGHPSVRVLETAVGSKDEEFLTLHRAGALTTSHAALYHEYSTVSWAAAALTTNPVVVGSMTLNTLLSREQVPYGFDLLVVDVEGGESAVFAGFSLQEWRPKMMVVELSYTHPDLRTTNADDRAVESSILNHGYRIVFKDQINTVFVRGDIWKGGATD